KNLLQSTLGRPMRKPFLPLIVLCALATSLAIAGGYSRADDLDTKALEERRDVHFNRMLNQLKLGNPIDEKEVQGAVRAHRNLVDRLIDDYKATRRPESLKMIAAFCKAEG